MFRRIFVALSVMLLTSTMSQAANTKLSSLSAAGAISGTNLIYVVQTPGSGGVAATATQFQTFICGVGSGCVQAPTALTTGDFIIGNGTNQSKDSLTYGTNGGIALSGGSTPSYGNCYWNDVDTCTTENVRARERTLLGNAVLATDNRTGSAVWNSTWWGSLPSLQQGTSYLVRDSQLAVMTDRGGAAIAGMALSSQGDVLGASKPAPIGVSGYCNNNTTVANSNCWAGYFESIYAPNGVASLSFGLEIDVRNTTSTNTIGNAYSVGQGDIGLWMGAGAGEGSGTGAPNPSVAAMVTTPNTQTFNTGIIFKDGSLTKDGSSNSVALSMGQGATLQWLVSSGVIGANIRSTVSTSGDDMSMVFANNQVLLQSTSGAALLNINEAQSSTLPTIAFATCGTNCGFFAPAANELELSINAGRIFDYNITNGGIFSFGVGVAMGSQSITQINTLQANNAAAYQFANTAASSTVPTLIPNRGSTTTGFGAQAAGNISAVIAGTEAVRFVAAGLQIPTVTTGTAATAACFDSSNNLIKSSASSDCFAGGGASGANPTATAGPAAINGSATTFMRSDAAPAVQKASSSQFGIVEVDNTTITSNAGVITATPQLSSRTVTSSPDTILSTDLGNIVYYNSASAVAVTQPAPTGSFASGFFTTLCNINAGVVTVTPGSGTIGGNATLPIGAGTASAPHCVGYQSNGTNFNLVTDGVQPGTIVPNVLGSSRQPSGTTDTLLAADCGSQVIYTSNSAVAVTVPSSIVPAGTTTCNIAIIQGGTAKVTLTGSGVTIISGHSYTGTSGTKGSAIGLDLATVSAAATGYLTGDGS
jgi:hypothetical protein